MMSKQLSVLSLMWVLAVVATHASATAPSLGTPQPHTLNLLLREAIRKGESVEVNKLLDAGANPNLSGRFELITDGNIEGPLLLDSIALRAFGPTAGENTNTARIQYLKIIKALMAHGANVNAVNSDNESALTEAAFWNESDIIKLLLTKHAAIEHKDNDGNTALLIALSASSEAFAGTTCQAEAALLLLRNGANPLIRDRAGKTALHLMAEDTSEDGPNDKRNFLKLARLILSSGADPWAKDENGLFAIQLATDPGTREEYGNLLRSAMLKTKPRVPIPKAGI